MSHFREYALDESDSDDDIPPPSGFSQEPVAYRPKIVIDDPSSASDESDVEIVEDADDSIACAFDKLAISGNHQQSDADEDGQSDVSINEALVDKEETQAEHSKPEKSSGAENDDNGTVYLDARASISSITPTMPTSDDEILVDSSPKSRATSTAVQVLEIKTPKQRVVFCDDDHDSSSDGDDSVLAVKQEGPFATPKHRSCSSAEHLLVDTSPEQGDSSTTLQEGSIQTPEQRPISLDSDTSLVDTSPEQDDDSTVVQEGRIKTPKQRLAALDSDDSLVDTSPEHSVASTVVQEGRIRTPKRRPTALDSDDSLVDTSLEEDDATVIQEGRVKTPKQRTIAIDSDVSLVDTSPEHSDTSTVIQEGRIRTPKLRSVALDIDESVFDTTPEQDDGNDDEDSLEESSVLQGSKTPEAKHTAVDDLENSAWVLDTSTGEVVLSADKYEISGVSWPDFRIPVELYKRLYNHQKAGVQWMASLYSNRVGGILGDDMGMGKTYQTLTYIGGLMRARTIRNALVVAPLSVLRSWENEARVIIKRLCVFKVTILVVNSEMAKMRRCRVLREALSCKAYHPYLVITTYGLVHSGPLDFVSDYHDWDVVVLDEGHKIKNNSAQVSKACRRICTSPDTRRLMLTGTPIQNNLKELWAVFDWATSGQLLGTIKSFMEHYGKPIENGRDKNALQRTIEIAERANNSLQEMLRPYFLQRMKEDFMSDELPPKRELVIWTHLSVKQRQMYECYVKGDKVAEVLRGDVKSPLEAVTFLKKLCGHPVLVESTGEYDRAIHVDSQRPEFLVQESAKLGVLISLLERLKSSGHRTLIFSQSTKMLDIIEHVLCRLRLARIDGSTRERERQRLVEAFNSEESNFDAMLLSTKAAGIGITLTGADRAIIYDPSWNSAQDAQAVDRCYRIGQEKDTTVYRFITAGTVEEKMYEKQVHKDGIRRAVMTSAGNATERYFDRHELGQLFTLAPAGTCEVLAKIQNGKDHRHALESSGKPTFLETHVGVVGVSSHDAVYSESSEADTPGAPETPFGGGASAEKPRVIGRSQRALTKRKIDFSIANKENESCNDKAPVSVSTNVARRPEPDECELSCDDVGIFLDQVDVLKAQGDLINAMRLLLDLVEKSPSDKNQKLRMHKGLAEIGQSLGWL